MEVSEPVVKTEIKEEVKTPPDIIEDEQDPNFSVREPENYVPSEEPTEVAIVLTQNEEIKQEEVEVSGDSGDSGDESADLEIVLNNEEPRPRSFPPTIHINNKFPQNQIGVGPQFGPHPTGARGGQGMRFELTDIDSLEDKPWQKPGVDITDYFNYGFTEQTWKEYYRKQLQMRMENQMQGKISVYESRNAEEEETSAASSRERRPAPAPAEARYRPAPTRKGFPKGYSVPRSSRDDDTVISLVGSENNEAEYNEEQNEDHSPRSEDYRRGSSRYPPYRMPGGYYHRGPPPIGFRPPGYDRRSPSYDRRSPREDRHSRRTPSPHRERDKEREREKERDREKGKDRERSKKDSKDKEKESHRSSRTSHRSSEKSSKDSKEKREKDRSRSKERESGKKHKRSSSSAREDSSRKKQKK